MNTDQKSADHWNGVYINAEPTKLGWSQVEATPSLELIRKCALKPSDLILDIGSGESVLIDNLLSLGFSHIIANDISEEALKASKKRLGEVRAEKVRWMVDDVLNPTALQEIEEVSLWHDRAVFHFFTTQDEQTRYSKLLDKLVKRGGFVILATFNLEGAEKCSGLEVKRHDVEMLSSFLDKSYILIHWFNHLYTMPSGAERPYIYALFQKL